MPHLLTAAAAVVACIVAAACTVSAAPPQTRPSRDPVPVSPPAARPTAPAQAAATGEVPADLVARMRADLAKRMNLDASEASVVSAQEVTWPNGALGCAQPGEIHTQALVPGYRVELEAGGRTYAYHAAKTGYFKLCRDRLRAPAEDRAAR